MVYVLDSLDLVCPLAMFVTQIAFIKSSIMQSQRVGQALYGGNALTLVSRRVHRTPTLPNCVCNRLSAFHKGYYSSGSGGTYSW